MRPLYYATPERFYVRRNGPIRRIEQLDGGRIGVCTGCFADLYLQRRLDIPGTVALHTRGHLAAVDDEQAEEEGEMPRFALTAKGHAAVDRYLKRAARFLPGWPPSRA